MPNINDKLKEVSFVYGKFILDEKEVKVIPIKLCAMPSSDPENLKESISANRPGRANAYVLGSAYQTQELKFKKHNPYFSVITPVLYVKLKK